MLSLTRKPGEKILIGNGISITVQEVSGSRVRLGIEAPQELRVQRAELLEKISIENQRAASAHTTTTGQVKALVFDEGLIGVARLRRFGLFQAATNSQVHILQSLDDPSFSLFVIDPKNAFPGYPSEMAKEAANLEDEDIAIATTITVPDSGEATVNLAAPIVIGLNSMHGKQVVLDEKTLHIQHPVKLAITA